MPPLVAHSAEENKQGATSPGTPPKGSKGSHQTFCAQDLRNRRGSAPFTRRPHPGTPPRTRADRGISP